MTREIIEGAKEVFIPYIMGELIHYNVGGNGEAHANQARKDLEEIFGLAIKALEQEPKTGHWIYVGEENEEETKNGNFRYVCSECGFSDVHAKTTYVPYCWHCGAKMAESEGT